MTLRRCTLLASLLLIATTAVGCSSGARYRETRVIVLPDAPAMAGIDVRTANGAVDISTAPRESQATIVASLRAKTKERLERIDIIAGYEGETLVVSVVWPDGRRRSSEGATFDIEVPGVADATVDTGNGAINLAGAQGDADLNTSNGRIKVERHRGSVVADTSNGRIEISGELDDVDARTSNGAVRIAGADGPVRVRTGNGSVVVELADGNPGPVEARSSNGSIRFNLSEAFRGRLRLETTNGRVVLEDAPMARIHSISRNRAELTIGDSAAESSADTTNGTVTVRFRGESD
ncbi:MAG: DUF4097 domain-containing protein [Phycisphaerales bacterium]